MIVTIHQPYFLPWLGYFNKLLHSNNFVILDDVNFRIRYYHSRVNAKDMHGNRCWLTLPTGSNHAKPINSIQVKGIKSVKKLFKTIEYSYSKAPYFNEYWYFIKKAIEVGYPSLIQININCIKTILNLLDHEVNMYLSSELYSGNNPTDRLITGCQLTNSNRILMGEGGSFEYHDLRKITNENIKFEKQIFFRNHPIYKQVGNGFIPYLSTIDAIFNVGPETTKEIILKSWTPTNGFLERETIHNKE